MDKLNNVSIVDKCIGCGLCAFLCPKDAIIMKEDLANDHFIYPSVNTNRCVSCGICLKKCPVTCLLNEKVDLYAPVYKYRFGNKESLLKSSSGGAFQGIVTDLFDEKCVVYGAAWNGLQVVHKRITNLSELEQLLSSKYIQSNIDKSIYKSIKDDLESGLFVVFSGTPCQNAAIASLVGEQQRKQMLLIEILCHGVPNQWGFDRCIEHEEKIIKGKINEFAFRYKIDTNIDNRKFKYVFETDSKKYSVIGDFQYFPFYKYYHTYSIYRSSCYQCKFREHRYSDIVIGDFWGANKLLNEQNPWSISFMVPLTHKGKMVANKIGEAVNLSLIDVAQENEAFLKNRDPDEKYMDFYKRITDFNFYKKIRISPPKKKTEVMIKNVVKACINIFSPKHKKISLTKTTYKRQKYK